jgi:hypothetical protein
MMAGRWLADRDHRITAAMVLDQVLSARAVAALIG